MSHTTEKLNIVETDATLIAITKEYVQSGRIATKPTDTILKHPHRTSTETSQDPEQLPGKSSELALITRKLQTKPKEECDRYTRLAATTNPADTKTRALLNCHSGRQSDSYLNPSYCNVKLNSTPKTGG